MRGIVLLIGLVLWMAPAAAQSWNPLETTNQARQRHQAEDYQFRQRNPSSINPRGEALGDPRPRGGIYDDQPLYGRRSGGYGGYGEPLGGGRRGRY